MEDNNKTDIDNYKTSIKVTMDEIIPLKDLNILSGSAASDSEPDMENDIPPETKRGRNRNVVREDPAESIDGETAHQEIEKRPVGKNAVVFVEDDSDSDKDDSDDGSGSGSDGFTMPQELAKKSSMIKR